MTIKFLKAFNGDSILIKYKENSVVRNILIDGGIGSTYFQKNKKGKIQYNELFEVIESIRENGEKIDLLILTHVDDDHIGGILKWFKTDQSAIKLIDRVWFNSGRTIKQLFESDKKLDYDNTIELEIDDSTDTSIGQGVKFENFLKENGVWNEKIIQAEQEIELLGLSFKILSPDEDKLKNLLGKWKKEKPDTIDTTVKNDYQVSIEEHISNDDDFKEDKSKHNGSSIGFVMTFNGKNMMFLGDAFPSVVVSSLKSFGYSKESPIDCEFVKISHHGSKSNNSRELLELINTNNYIISTNGDKHSHPHKKLLSRIINHKNDCDIYFNYPELIDEMFSKNDIKAYSSFNPLPINSEFNIK
ncbi:MAG: MBL fold metallo-hydrolase [Flavobacteriales bacterium]|nr:MBL fold metallo-hydrolase [Flavobacteriales bacterium]